LLQRSRFEAAGQTVAATGAFAFDHFVHVMNVLHFRMNRAFETGFAAKAAGAAQGCIVSA
jgi:hypothetical protein